MALETKDIEILVGELETRVDRLRHLYDQYFLGFEKIEPTVARKDVDRRLEVLRREQIRNTALRFRFQMITQKYNTHQSLWFRTCRQIEEGTFKRHVQKAKKRFGDDAVTGRDVALDMDVDLDDLEAAVERDLETWEQEPPTPVPAAAPVSARFPGAPAALGAKPGAAAPGGFPGMPPVRAPAASSPVFPGAPPPSVRHVDASVPPASGSAPGSSPTFPGAPAAAPRPHRPAVVPQGTLVQKARPVARRPDGDGTDTDPSALAPEPGAPAPAPVRAPQGPRLPGAPAPIAARPLPGAPASSPRFPGAPPSSPGVPPARGPAPSSPDLPPMRPPAGTVPGVAPPARAPAPLPAGLPPMRPPAGTVPGVAPPARAPAPPPAGPPSARAPLPGAPPAARPVGAPPPSAGPSSAVPPRSVPKPAPALPSGRGAPLSVPPRPMSAPAGGDMSDARVREIYTQYANARKSRNEPDASFEAVQKSLAASAAKLREQHKGKAIDFEVSEKDGKTVLRPIVKK